MPLSAPSAAREASYVRPSSSPAPAPSMLQCLPGFHQLRCERTLRWQMRRVRRGMHSIPQPFHRIPHHLLILGRTQNQPDRRILILVRPVRLGVVEVHVHLPRIPRREVRQLEINDDKTPKPPVIQQQIHPSPRVADAKPPLPRHEREITPKLQQERLKVPDQRLLQFMLGVLILEIQELEHEGILDLLVGAYRILVLRPRTLHHHRLLVP